MTLRAKYRRLRRALPRCLVLAAYLSATAGFAYPTACAEEAGGCCCHDAGDPAAAECCCCAATVADGGAVPDVQSSDGRAWMAGDSRACAEGTVSGLFALFDRALQFRHAPAVPKPDAYENPVLQSRKAPVSLRAPPVHARSAA